MATYIAIDTNTSTKDESQLVTFQLGEEEFGFDIMSVQEIIRPPKMARVPKSPSYVDGVANLRGVVMPIVDTRSRFGMERSEETDRTRVLVIDIDGVKTGLRVDRVKQVTRISHSDMETPPKAIRGVNGDFLKSVCKLENGKRIIMALNPTQVCEVNIDKQTGEGAGLRNRTEAAGEEATGVKDDIEQMVTFRLAKEEFAFRIDRVREILRVESPKEVPDTPAYVLGVLTVRGKILPIIDLRRLLSHCSLAEELATRCKGLSDMLGAWMEQAKRHVGTGAKLTDLSGPDSLRKWLSEFNPASQVLLESAAKLRAANDHIIKAAKDLDGSTDRVKAFDAEIAPSASEVTSILANLGRQFEEHIREDQRIIVVESRGVLLGLVVDHVNEVLNISKALIDPPPKLTCADGMQMAGIAKLQDGKRLIMALDSDRLLKDESLQEVQKLDTTGGDEQQHKKETTQKAQEMAEEQLVTFLLDKEEFGIPISQIQEIDRVSQITRVPKAPSFVEGVTNLRGEVIPVISTRKRFEMEVKPVDDRTRVIIVDINGVKTGLLVDSVRENLNLPKKDIAPPPHAIESGVDSRFISGIGKVDNGKRMIVLLNVQQILSTQEQSTLVESAAK